MKTLLAKASGGLNAVQLIERPYPEHHASLVTVAIRAVGLCRTDLLVAQGKIATSGDIVLGHEGAGVVVNDPTGRFQAGEAVAINPYLPQGKFLGLHVDGILQEAVQLPVEQLIPAEGLPFHVAAYVEPVAASMAVLKALGHARDLRGLLLGNNRIAHLTYLILQSLGYQVDWVKEPTYQGAPDSYDYAIETLFEKTAIHSLLTALKPEGLLVVKSRQFAPTEIIAALLVQKELSFKAVNYADFNLAMAWLARHRDTVAPLLGERFAMEDWARAFEAASEPTALKIFIEV
jgi:threonine dehydrogenase-like Zn-dependent dehydrogenase